MRVFQTLLFPLLWCLWLSGCDSHLHSAEAEHYTTALKQELERCGLARDGPHAPRYSGRPEVLRWVPSGLAGCTSLCMRWQTTLLCRHSANAAGSFMPKRRRFPWRWSFIQRHTQANHPRRSPW